MNPQIFISALDGCLEALDSLKFRRKAEQLHNQDIGGQPALIIYLDRLLAYLSCALAGRQEHIHIRRKYERLESGLEELRRQVRQKHRAKNKSVDKHIIGRRIKSNATKLCKILANSRLPIRECEGELASKHRAFAQLWPDL